MSPLPNLIKLEKEITEEEKRPVKSAKTKAEKSRSQLDAEVKTFYSFEILALV